MHGSVNIIDALKYASGPICCRVDITGDLSVDSDKIAGRSRKVLWMVDATSVLHEFACRCAEDALTLICNPDPLSIAAIKSKRDWLAGKINDEELYAAWYATCCPAQSAVQSLPQSVARDLAHAAAQSVAQDAANDVVWYAAWYAGTKRKQRNRLTAMVCSARKEK